MKKTVLLICACALVLIMTAGIAAFADSGYETWDDYGYGVRSQVDEIFADGKSISGGSAGDYLSVNQYIIAGKYETLTFKGWAGYDQVITGVGYAIDGGENVFGGELIPAAADSHAAAYGGDNVTYYSIDVPVAGITEKTRLTLLAQLEDGTAVALNRYDVFVQEKKEQIVQKEVALTQGGTGRPICFSDYGSVAFKIHIPEQWRLGQFVVINSPTWDMTGAGLTADIYKWDTDYDTTLKGKSLSTCLIEDHINCTSMVITFGYVPEGDYLVEFTDFELKIGGYEANGPTSEQASTFKYFVDELEETSGIPQLKMVLYDNTVPPQITEAPATEVPTEAPTAAPTDVPTDVPDKATDAPVEDKTQEPADNDATPEPGNDDDAPKKSGNVVLPIVLGAVGVAVIAAAAVLILKKKKAK